MFPVEFLVARLSSHPHFLTETLIQETFESDLERYGNVKFKGGCVMSCGPFGATMFYRFEIVPPDALQLALLLEYSQQPKNGMVAGVLRDNRQVIGSPGERLGTYLHLSEEGGFLDELPPPETTPLVNMDIDMFELQSQIVAEWLSARDYIDSLETEILVLKARLDILNS